eukprot:5865782-Pyramimonas_sp.AAC.1
MSDFPKLLTLRESPPAMRTHWLPAGSVGRALPSAIHSVTPDVWPRPGSGPALSGSAFCSLWSFPLQSSLRSPCQYFTSFCPRTARIGY